MSETGPHDNSRQDLTEKDKTIIYVCALLQTPCHPYSFCSLSSLTNFYFIIQ